MMRLDLVFVVLGVAGVASVALAQATSGPGSQPAGAPPAYLIDMAGFLNDLKLDRPELAAVKAALDKGDLAQAGRAYVAYFRKKDISSPLWTDWAGMSPDANFSTAKADGLLAGHMWDGYNVYEVPATGIDWHKATLPVLTRFPIFPTLLDAAFNTKDPKYARFLVGHIMEYMAADPMAEFVGKGSFSVGDNNAVNQPWHWSIMPMRVQQVSQAMALVRAYSEVTDDELLAVLHRMHQEAAYCRLVMKRWVDKRHNGGKSYILAMTFACKLLEDFKAADEWSANNATLLAQYINQSFYPDGQNVEMATSYGGNAGFSAQQLASLLTDREGIKAARPKLAAMVDWSIGLSKPTGHLPSFGDLSARHVSGTIYRPLLDWLNVPYAKTILDRTAGPLPPHTVWPAPGKEAWCGYYTMRSDWTDQAIYMCIGAGPRGISYHGHGDKLSFVVTAHGADLIIDPTSTSYRNNEPDSFISTQAASFLHNTVTIDGVDEFMNEPEETKTPLANPWEHGKRYAFFEGTYSFAPVKPVTWKRRVVFADKSYWLLQDVLAGDLDAAAVEQNFQFEKDTKIEFDGPRTIATAPNGARLLLVPFVEGMQPVLSLGDEKPHMTYWPDGKPKPNLGIKAGTAKAPHGRGWTGRTGNKLLPAPAVTYAGKVKLPATITIAIIPIAPGDANTPAPKITVTTDSQAADNQTTVWTLPTAGGAIRVESSPAACKVRE